MTALIQKHLILPVVRYSSWQHWYKNILYCLLWDTAHYSTDAETSCILCYEIQLMTALIQKHHILPIVRYSSWEDWYRNIWYCLLWETAHDCTDIETQHVACCEIQPMTALIQKYYVFPVVRYSSWQHWYRNITYFLLWDTAHDRTDTETSHIACCEKQLMTALIQKRHIFSVARYSSWQHWDRNITYCLLWDTAHDRTDTETSHIVCVLKGHHILVKSLFAKCMSCPFGELSVSQLSVEGAACRSSFREPVIHSATQHFALTLATAIYLKPILFFLYPPLPGLEKKLTYLKHLFTKYTIA